MPHRVISPKTVLAALRERQAFRSIYGDEGLPDPQLERLIAWVCWRFTYESWMDREDERDAELLRRRRGRRLSECHAARLAGDLSDAKHKLEEARKLLPDMARLYPRLAPHPEAGSTRWLNWGAARTRRAGELRRELVASICALLIRAGARTLRDTHRAAKPILTALRAAYPNHVTGGLLETPKRLRRFLNRKLRAYRLRNPGIASRRLLKIYAKRLLAQHRGWARRTSGADVCRRCGRRLPVLPGFSPVYCVSCQQLDGPPRRIARLRSSRPTSSS